MYTMYNFEKKIHSSPFLGKNLKVGTIACYDRELLFLTIITPPPPKVIMEEGVIIGC